MNDPLFWLPEELEPVAFRLARADECAYEISDLVSAWPTFQPVEILQTLQDGEVTSYVESIRPIPPRIAILFSEAISHIRASVDNVMWHIVTADQTGQLTEYAQRLIEFPITETPKAFEKWCARRVNNGLEKFEEGSALVQRLKSLQPWNDQIATIPSVSETLAAIRKEPTENAQALLLLQKYSNDDKHRSVQLAVVRTPMTTDDKPICEQDLAFKELRPGTILRRSKLGSPTIMELNPAAVIVRPAPYKDEVNPATEVTWLRKYVSETVIPILLRGLALAYKLPPEIDMTDNGKTHRERLQEAGWREAPERFAPVLRTRCSAVLDTDVEIAKIREPEFEVET